MPVAVKLTGVPMGVDGAAGVIAIAVKTGAVTFKMALLEVTPFAEAVMVVVPCAKLEAMPLVFNVAIPVFAEAQVTDPEMSPVVLSEKVPMAVKVTGVPLGVDGAVGLMLIPVTTAAVTAMLAVGDVMPLSEAVTVVLPTATPVNTPVAPLVVATPVLADTQDDWLVMLAVEASV